MAVKNAFLEKIRLEKELELERARIITMQWCADAAVLAANDVFKRKGEKIVEFVKSMERYSQEIAHLTIEDAKADKNIEYTKSVVDERLKTILGEHFQPWEERY